MSCLINHVASRYLWSNISRSSSSSSSSSSHIWVDNGRLPIAFNRRHSGPSTATEWWTCSSPCLHKVQVKHTTARLHFFKQTRIKEANGSFFLFVFIFGNGRQRRRREKKRRRRNNFQDEEKKCLASFTDAFKT